MKNNTRGGKREGAGRKSISNKKVQLPIYIPKNTIRRLGREYIRTKVYEFLKTLENEISQSRQNNSDKLSD